MTQKLRGYSLALGAFLSVLALAFQLLYAPAGALLWAFAIASFGRLARRSLI